MINWIIETAGIQNDVIIGVVVISVLAIAGIGLLAIASVGVFLQGLWEKRKW